MSAEEEVVEALKVLRIENQRLSADNAQLRVILSEYPSLLTRLTSMVERLGGLVPLLEAWMETAQVRRAVQEFSFGPGAPDYPASAEAGGWDGASYGLAPPPVRPRGPANGPPEAADPNYIPGEGIVPQHRESDGTGLTLPEEPEDWEEPR